MAVPIPVVARWSALSLPVGSPNHHATVWTALVVVLSSFGCCTMRDARYVYQDGQCGVVGIPEDTSRWPHYYRTQAQRLMGEHFPDGYEIVRAEEVTEGSRTRTVGGSVTAELTPGLPSDVITVGKLGRTATLNQADVLKIKECRIVYKRADRGCTSGAYARQPTYSPTLYVDPNEAERRYLKSEPPPSEMKGSKSGTRAGGVRSARGPAERPCSICDPGGRQPLG